MSRSVIKNLIYSASYYNFVDLLDRKTICIAESVQTAKLLITVLINPKHSTSKISKKDWDYYCSSIRQSQDFLCSSTLNKGFFSEINEFTDAIFLLYSISSKGEGKTTLQLIGFVLCDFNDNISDKKYESLYIDAICANPKNVKHLTKVDDDILNSLSAGSILLNYVEYWGVNNPNKYSFKQLKLSALAYVINYYRRPATKGGPGFKLTNDCSKPEDPEIVQLADLNAKRKFRSEDYIDNLIRVEKAYQLSNDNPAEFNKLLYEYLSNSPAEAPSPAKHTPTIKRKSDEIELTPAERSNPQSNKQVAYLVKEVSSNTNKGANGILDLLLLLTKKGYSVSCQEGSSKPTKRAWYTKIDEANKCLDDGFTMVKCMPPSLILGKCSTTATTPPTSSQKPLVGGQALDISSIIPGNTIPGVKIEVIPSSIFQKKKQKRQKNSKTKKKKI